MNSLAELEQQIIEAFGGVESGDLRYQHRGLGTDDLPKLAITERCYTEATRRAYGEWGATRSYSWGGADGRVEASRAVAYIRKFVAKNGRVKVALVSPRGGRRFALVVSS